METTKGSVQWSGFAASLIGTAPTGTAPPSRCATADGGPRPSRNPIQPINGYTRSPPRTAPSPSNGQSSRKRDWIRPVDLSRSGRVLGPGSILRTQYAHTIPDRKCISSFQESFDSTAFGDSTNHGDLYAAARRAIGSADYVGGIQGSSLSDSRGMNSWNPKNRFSMEGERGGSRDGQRRTNHPPNILFQGPAIRSDDQSHDQCDKSLHHNHVVTCNSSDNSNASDVFGNQRHLTPWKNSNITSNNSTHFKSSEFDGDNVAQETSKMESLRAGIGSKDDDSRDSSMRLRGTRIERMRLDGTRISRIEEAPLIDPDNLGSKDSFQRSKDFGRSKEISYRSNETGDPSIDFSDRAQNQSHSQSAKDLNPRTNSMELSACDGEPVSTTRKPLPRKLAPERVQAPADPEKLDGIVPEADKPGADSLATTYVSLSDDCEGRTLMNTISDCLQASWMSRPDTGSSDPGTGYHRPPVSSAATDQHRRPKVLGRQPGIIDHNQTCSERPESSAIGNAIGDFRAPQDSRENSLFLDEGGTDVEMNFKLGDTLNFSTVIEEDTNDNLWTDSFFEPPTIDQIRSAAVMRDPRRISTQSRSSKHAFRPYHPDNPMNRAGFSFFFDRSYASAVAVPLSTAHSISGGPSTRGTDKPLCFSQKLEICDRDFEFHAGTFKSQGFYTKNTKLEAETEGRRLRASTTRYGKRKRESAEETVVPVTTFRGQKVEEASLRKSFPLLGNAHFALYDFENIAKRHPAKAQKILDKLKNERKLDQKRKEQLSFVRKRREYFATVTQDIAAAEGFCLGDTEPNLSRPQEVTTVGPRFRGKETDSSKPTTAAQKVQKRNENCFNSSMLLRDRFFAGRRTATARPVDSFEQFEIADEERRIRTANPGNLRLSLSHSPVPRQRNSTTSLNSTSLENTARRANSFDLNFTNSIGTRSRSNSIGVRTNSMGASRSPSMDTRVSLQSDPKPDTPQKRSVEGLEIQLIPQHHNLSVEPVLENRSQKGEDVKSDYSISSDVRAHKFEVEVKRRSPNKGRSPSREHGRSPSRGQGRSPSREARTKTLRSPSLEQESGVWSESPPRTSMPGNRSMRTSHGSSNADSLGMNARASTAAGTIQYPREFDSFEYHSPENVNVTSTTQPPAIPEILSPSAPRKFIGSSDINTRVLGSVCTATSMKGSPRRIRTSPKKAREPKPQSTEGTQVTVKPNTSTGGSRDTGREHRRRSPTGGEKLPGKRKSCVVKIPQNDENFPPEAGLPSNLASPSEIAPEGYGFLDDQVQSSPKTKSINSRGTPGRQTQRRQIQSRQTASSRHTPSSQALGSQQLTLDKPDTGSTLAYYERKLPRMFNNSRNSRMSSTQDGFRRNRLLDQSQDLTRRSVSVGGQIRESSTVLDPLRSKNTSQEFGDVFGLSKVSVATTASASTFAAFAEGLKNADATKRMQEEQNAMNRTAMNRTPISKPTLRSTLQSRKRNSRGFDSGSGLNVPSDKLSPVAIANITSSLSWEGPDVKGLTCTLKKNYFPPVVKRLTKSTQYSSMALPPPLEIDLKGAKKVLEKYGYKTYSERIIGYHY